MTDEKKNRGRPRKYASSAERSRAYRERKKVKIMQLEQHARELKNNLKGLKQSLSPEIEKKINSFLFGFLCRGDGIDFSENNRIDAQKKLEDLLHTYQEIRSFYETPSEDEI